GDHRDDGDPLPGWKPGFGISEKVPTATIQTQEPARTGWCPKPHDTAGRPRIRSSAGEEAPAGGGDPRTDGGRSVDRLDLVPTLAGKAGRRRLLPCHRSR